MWQDGTGREGRTGNRSSGRGGQVEGVEELLPMGPEPHPTAKPLALRAHRSSLQMCVCMHFSLRSSRCGSWKT